MRITIEIGPNKLTRSIGKKYTAAKDYLSKLLKRKGATVERPIVSTPTS